MSCGHDRRVVVTDVEDCLIVAAHEVKDQDFCKVISVEWFGFNDSRILFKSLFLQTNSTSVSFAIAVYVSSQVHVINSQIIAGTESGKMIAFPMPTSADRAAKAASNCPDDRADWKAEEEEEAEDVVLEFSGVSDTFDVLAATSCPHHFQIV